MLLAKTRYLSGLRKYFGISGPKQVKCVGEFQCTSGVVSLCTVNKHCKWVIFIRGLLCRHLSYWGKNHLLLYFLLTCDIQNQKSQILLQFKQFPSHASDMLYNAGWLGTRNATGVYKTIIVRTSHFTHLNTRIYIYSSYLALLCFDEHTMSGAIPVHSGTLSHVAIAIKGNSERV